MLSIYSDLSNKALLGRELPKALLQIASYILHRCAWRLPNILRVENHSNCTSTENSTWPQLIETETEVRVVLSPESMEWYDPLVYQGKVNKDAQDFLQNFSWWNRMKIDALQSHANAFAWYLQFYWVTSQRILFTFFPLFLFLYLLNFLVLSNSRRNNISNSA